VLYVCALLVLMVTCVLIRMKMGYFKFSMSMRCCHRWPRALLFFGGLYEILTNLLRICYNGFAQSVSRQLLGKHVSAKTDSL
jgi:hypothetical protein